MVVSNLVAAFVGGFGAVWAYSALAAHTWLELAYGMLLLPAHAEFFNDERRIARAKAGMSGTRAMMVAAGNLEDYDQQRDVRSERAAEAGRVTGYLAGLVLFVRDAPFFW